MGDGRLRNATGDELSRRRIGVEHAAFAQYDVGACPGGQHDRPCLAVDATRLARFSRADGANRERQHAAVPAKLVGRTGSG